MNLLRDILSSRWAIQEDAAVKLMPLVSNIITGSQSAVQATVEAAYPMVMEVQDDTHDASIIGKVAVIPVKGVITKYDNCGTLGLQSIEQYLQYFDNQPSITGVVLDMDTPGGEASYLPNIAETIASMKKPVVSFYSGVCASAGYYIASQTDEIYASTETDVVGSIGTMVQFVTPHPDNKDLVLHSVYATKSTRKNEAFRSAMEGKYDLIRSQMLDPLNEVFHKTVLSSRPGIDKEALSGAVYNTQKAIDMKLIDGRLASLKEAVVRVVTLGKASNQTINNQSNSEMKKFETISAILGKEVTAETVLTAEDLAAIEAAKAVPAAQPEAANPAPTAEEIAASLSGNVTEAVASALAPVTEKISALEAKIEEFEKGAGASASVATPTAGSGSETEPWNDPSRSYNKL